MATSQDHNALLDQLQSQVNAVLEQTGRVFAAVNTNPNAPPKAQVNKLKSVLPVAHGRFHDALDQLEAELQLAQLVMRRDLALCREREGQGAPDVPRAQPMASIAPPTASIPEVVREEVEVPKPVDETAAAPVSTADIDVAMEDTAPDNSTAQTTDDSADIQMSEAAPAIDQEPQPSGSGVETETQANTDDQEKPKSPPKQDTPDVATTTDNSLQLDTNPSAQSALDKPSEEEKAPDTAQESNTGDLESLFGGGTDNNDFTFDQTNASEIDFGDFSTNFNTDNGDNDNISSLLPGLEDYANTQPNGNGGELDLNSFFNNSGDGQGNTMNQQNNGEQRDTTFDDLMDLANFDTSGMDDGSNNATSDFQFDSLFE